jgi:hypothetical protein
MGHGKFLSELPGQGAVTAEKRNGQGFRDQEGHKVQRRRAAPKGGQIAQTFIAPQGQREDLRQRPLSRLTSAPGLAAIGGGRGVEPKTTKDFSKPRVHLIPLRQRQPLEAFHVDGIGLDGVNRADAAGGPGAGRSTARTLWRALVGFGSRCAEGVFAPERNSFGRDKHDPPTGSDLGDEDRGWVRGWTTQRGRMFILNQ